MAALPMAAAIPRGAEELVVRFLALHERPKWLVAAVNQRLENEGNQGTADIAADAFNSCDSHNGSYGASDGPLPPTPDIKRCCNFAA